jgi:hypothetical protein
MDHPTSAAPATTSAVVANRNPAGPAGGATAGGGAPPTPSLRDCRRAGGPAGVPAARGASVVLGHPLQAVGQLLRQQPRVVRRSVAALP